MNGVIVPVITEYYMKLITQTVSSVYSELSIGARRIADDNMIKVCNIRQIFLDFFEQHRHKIVPSAPLATLDDPTLLLRLSVGIEDVDDLIEDLEQVLGKAR